MEDDFQAVGSGASATIPMQCSSIKKGAYAVMKGHPCKVVETSTSKTGKHGHAKVHMVGIDIFTSKKHEEICPSTHNMEVPVVNRAEYTLIDISDDGFCSLMLADGSTKDDLRLPDEAELADAMRAAFDGGKEVLVNVTSAMGTEQIMQFKET